MPKHRSKLTSGRLQRVLTILRAAGRRGITSLQIIMAAQVTDPGDVIYELRWHGVDVVGEWEDGHKRYWLGEHVAQKAS